LTIASVPAWNARNLLEAMGVPFPAPMLDSRPSLCHSSGARHGSSSHLDLIAGDLGTVTWTGSSRSLRQHPAPIWIETWSGRGRAGSRHSAPSGADTLTDVHFRPRWTATVHRKRRRGLSRLGQWAEAAMTSLSSRHGAGHRPALAVFEGPGTSRWITSLGPNEQCPPDRRRLKTYPPPDYAYIVQGSRRDTKRPAVPSPRRSRKLTNRRCDCSASINERGAIIALQQPCGGSHRELADDRAAAFPPA